MHLVSSFISAFLHGQTSEVVLVVWRLIWVIHEIRVRFLYFFVWSSHVTTCMSLRALTFASYILFLVLRVNVQASAPSAKISLKIDLYMSSYTFLRILLSLRRRWNILMFNQISWFSLFNFPYCSDFDTLNMRAFIRLFLILPCLGGRSI